jgi:hypothetical protein
MSGSVPTVLPILAQAPVPDPAVVEFVKRFSWSLAGLLLVVLVVWLASPWLAAKAVAGSEGTWRNVFRYLGYSLAGGFAVGALQFLVNVIGAAADSEGFVAVFGFLLTILSLVVSFWVPMTVFSMGILRTLLFWILGAVIGTALFVAGLFVVPFAGSTAGLQGLRLYQASKGGSEEVDKFLRGLVGDLGLGVEAAGVPRAETLADKEARLQQLFTELTAERNQLNVADRAAVEAFNMRNAEYHKLLNEVKILRSGGGATPVPAPPAGR